MEREKKEVTLRKDGSIPTVTVIVIDNEGVLRDSLSFPEDNEGIINAEKHFKTQLEATGWTEEDDKPFEVCLEDGYYESQNDWHVCITHN